MDEALGHLYRAQARRWRVRRTASDPSNEPRQEKRGLRLSHLSWIVIAAAAVAGELPIQFSHHDQMEQFAAPVVNVPAFHVVSAADVRPLWRPASQVPRDAIRNANAVVGHVTLASLAANQPITASQLGPDAAGRQGGLSAVGVPATAAMVSSRQARPSRRSSPAQRASLATPRSSCCP